MSWLCIKLDILTIYLRPSSHAIKNSAGRECDQRKAPKKKLFSMHLIAHININSIVIL